MTQLVYNFDIYDGQLSAKVKHPDLRSSLNMVVQLSYQLSSVVSDNKNRKAEKHLK